MTYDGPWNGKPCRQCSRAAGAGTNPTTGTTYGYGWGRGGFRPVYPCTVMPQGLFQNRNRAEGLASTAGKYAAAFGLAAHLYADREPQFATTLRERAIAAYEVGLGEFNQSVFGAELLR